MSVRCNRCGTVSLVDAAFVRQRQPFNIRRVWLCPNCAARRQGTDTIFWLLMVAAAIATLFALDFEFRWLFGNLGLFLLMSYLSIVPHELGHALAARLVGLRLLRVALGTGRPRARWRTGDVAWEIRTWPFGGFTTFGARAPHTEHCLKLRMAIAVLAGPGANIALATLALWACPPVRLYEIGWFTEPNPWAALLAANLLLGLISLWPHHARLDTQPLRSDGRWLLELARQRGPEARRTLQAQLAMTVVDELRNRGEFHAALEHLEALRQWYGHEDAGIENHYGVLLTDLGRFDAALPIFEKLLAAEELDELHRGLFANNVAYALLAGGRAEDLPRAEAFAYRAMERMGWLPQVRSTYAAIQLLLGRDADADPMLTDAIARFTNPGDRATGMIFLALLARRRGDPARAADLEAAARADADAHPAVAVLLERLEAWATWPDAAPVPEEA